MATIVSDTFTDTDSISLHLHTPDVRPASAAWSERVGDWLITNNAASLATGLQNAHATIDVGESDQIILSARVAHDTGSTSIGRDVGVVLRWSDTTHYWYVSINEMAGAFRIIEYNGTASIRATTTVTLAPNTFYVVAVTVDGQTITATVDGVNEISYASASLNQSSTVHGICGRDTTTRIDWFLVETAEAGSVEVAPADLDLAAPVFGTPAATDDPTTYTDGPGGDVNSACDTLMSSGWPINNGGLHPEMSISSIQHALLRFDLSAIPVGAGVIWAKLYLYHSYPPEASGVKTGTIYSISEANSDWIEGTKDIDLAAAGEPCWNAKCADGAGGVQTAWAGSAGLETSGVDYESTPMGVATWDFGSALGTEFVVDLDPERVAGWCGASNTNYGVITYGTGAGDGHVGSSEHGTAAYRPKLVVVYAEAAAAAGGTTQEGAAALNGATTAGAVGTVVRPGSAALSASVSLAAAGLAVRLAAAALSASAALAGTPRATRGGAATLAGTSALSLTVIEGNLVTGQAALAGAAQVAVMASAVRLGTIGLSGASTLAAIGAGVRQGCATLAGLAALAAAGQATVAGAASLTGASSLTLLIIDGNLVTGVAALAGTNGLAALGLIVRPAGGHLLGDAALVAAGQRVAPGAMVLDGTSELVSFGLRLADGRALLGGNASLAPAGIAVRTAFVLLAGTSQLSLSTVALVAIMLSLRARGTSLTLQTRSLVLTLSRTRT